MSYIHLPEKGSPILVAIAYTVQCVYGGIHVHVIQLLYGMLVTETKILRLTTETKIMEIKATQSSSALMSFILTPLKYLIQFHIRDCWIVWGSGAISSFGLQHSYMIESREFLLKVSTLSG